MTSCLNIGEKPCFLHYGWLTMCFPMNLSMGTHRSIPMVWISNLDGAGN